MNTIRLKPKYEKIEKELIKNNEQFNNKEFNTFVKLYAQMIAQGLQLSEEYSDEQNK